MIEEAVILVKDALDSVPFLTVRETSFKSDQVNVLCRSSDATPDERHMKGLIDHILQSEDGWQSHICKRFMRRDGGTKYGWSFAFRSDDIGLSAQRIAKAVGFHVKNNVLPAEADDAGQAMGRQPVRNRGGDQSPRPGSYRGAYPTSG